MTAPGPMRVAVIDVDDPLTDLDCSREDTPPYAGAWILACRDGRPLGSVELPLRGTRVSAADLERELHGRLGEAWWLEPYGSADVPTLVHASVIVPTNAARPAQLRRCVQRLVTLDHPDYEVIVVDNRPAADAPLELAGARVIREARPGISAARNRGLAAATGEIIAFTDDDVDVDRRWLRALGERFARQPEVAAVTGLVVPLELETAAQVWFERSGSGPDRSYAPLTFELAGRFRMRRRDGETGAERVDSLYATGELGLGSNMAFRAAALRAAGGFDEALGTGTPSRGGEDLAMLVELLASGHPLAYEPSAIVYHTHRATLAELDRQIYGYGVGFTAMLTAIALRNPRHLAGLAAVVPRWLRSLRDPASAKHAGRPADYPGALARAELRGMLAGPFAYRRSRRMQRRWSAPAPATGPIKVCVIDVERYPASISGEPGYVALRALVREGGRPRGIIELPFDRGELTREELGSAIAALPPSVHAPPLTRPQSGRLPPISVVIPSMLERSSSLDDCLRSLAALDYPDYEVIVVDNRPAGSPYVDLPGVQVLSEPRPGISAARNRGLAVATGEIVAFTDDDVEVDRDWLLAIALRLRAHPEEAGVAGMAMPRELETAAQIALDAYYGGFGPVMFEPVSHRLRAPPGPWMGLRPATVNAVGDDGRPRHSFSLYAAGSFGAGANMAFRATALRELGGFDLALGAGTPAHGGEDLELFARLVWRGGSLGFEPAALVHHTHRREDEALRRQIEGWGSGYTALLLALVLEDPRHLGSMLATLPRVVRGHGSRGSSRDPPPLDPRLRELAQIERRGMRAGPAAYLRGRLRRSR